MGDSLPSRSKLFYPIHLWLPPEQVPSEQVPSVPNPIFIFFEPSAPLYWFRTQVMKIGTYHLSPVGAAQLEVMTEKYVFLEQSASPVVAAPCSQETLITNSQTSVTQAICVKTHGDILSCMHSLAHIVAPVKVVLLIHLLQSERKVGNTTIFVTLLLNNQKLMIAVNPLVF